MYVLLTIPVFNPQENIDDEASSPLSTNIVVVGGTPQESKDGNRERVCISDY